MISVAAVPRTVNAGHHVSLSETYPREGAICRSVSIEHWASGMEVHSYARSRLEWNAQSIAGAVQLPPSVTITHKAEPFSRKGRRRTINR